MAMEQTDVVVVGGGQAGVSMSEHLRDRGIEHVVLERNRIGERWRTGRWDSLVANGPAWHDRLPSMEFSSVAPDEFATKDQVADYLEEYARMIDAPIRTGVEVKRVRKNHGGRGFVVTTNEGEIQANYVVAATGPFQKPLIPTVVPDDAGIHQIHSQTYHNPEQLPEGNVLVVGAGSSGVQIAEELQASGRQVYLAVGPHDRPPRSYRNRDYCWWLGVLNKWEASAPPQGAEHVTISVSGAHGGKTIDFRDLAAQGIHLVGRAGEYENGVMHFSPDLEKNITRGDANYRSVLEEADEFITANGLDLPEEPEAHELGPMPECVTNQLTELDLKEAGVTSIVWATGYTQDYSWLEADTFDENGRAVHQRGVSEEPGVYFVGLPWLSRRGSSFIWGVWHDANYIAEHIRIQHNYMDHEPQKSLLGQR